MDRKENIADRIVEPRPGVSPPRKVPADHRTSVAPANSRSQPLRLQEDIAWDEV
jgi:hypothetical protein